MRRRDFIAGLGAIALPLPGRAQQRPLPVIGWLDFGYATNLAGADIGFAANLSAGDIDAFRQGIGEHGYFEGRNVEILYRFAEGQFQRWPELAADLVRRRVAVIVAGGTSAALAAKKATATIPVVFWIGSDPVRQGLVASANRPGGTFTGVSTLVGDLTTKNLGLMRELLPDARNIGMILNTIQLPYRAAEIERDAREAAAALGMQVFPLQAGTEGEIENAFVMLNEWKVDAIHLGSSPFLVTRARLLADLAARYRVPATYTRREFTDAGGLMSYGYDVADTYRQLGYYTARILTGTSPADLPVFQPTRFQLIINLKAAKALNLEIPPKVLALANEVIE